MDRYQAMKVFQQVAEAGGFAAASRKLNISPPAVTRTIAGLEDLIGARLLVRTTRSVKLTEAGERYLDECRRILAEIADAEAAAAGAYTRPTGTLTVTASVLFGQIYVLPIVTRFLDEHPHVTGRLLFVDRVTSLIDEGIDVAIRIGHLPDSSHAAIRVGSVRRVICASPTYFERAGVPATPQELAGHRIIAATAAWSRLDWRFGAAGAEMVDVKPALFCNSNEAAIAAARDGWGLTRVLSYQIGPDLQSGRLLTVLGEHEEAPLPIHIVHTEGRRASAKVRAFVDAATAALRANRLLN
jgi:DNA-binding transcriptional LysR family regulator